MRDFVILSSCHLFILSPCPSHSIGSQFTICSLQFNDPIRAACPSWIRRKERLVQRFEGKVALVTGAARGIGRGVALCLAEEGADIIVNDLPPVDGLGARGTVREVEQIGRQALAYDADISDRDQVAALFAAGVARFGHIDVVVANAAFSIREPMIEAQWEHVLRTLEVTQFGVYHTCQAGAQRMVQQGGGGKIVIIGSILSEIPFASSSAYNMAKAAVVH